MRGLLDPLLLLAALSSTAALARDVPENLQKLLDDIRAQGKCDNVLADGFHSSDGDSGGKCARRTRTPREMECAVRACVRAC